MSNIQDKKGVGNAPRIVAGAAVLILNDQGELLMMLRTDNSCWGLPGRAMEPGERLEDTARRETWEETSLHVDRLYLFDVFSGPELYYQYPNGDRVLNVTAVYIAPDASGEISLDLGEHSRWNYYPLDHLPDNISPPIKSILARFSHTKQPFLRVI